MKLWMICVDAKGTTTLKEGVKYLVEPRGNKAKVLRNEHNPHLHFGNTVNMTRFKRIRP